MLRFLLALFLCLAAQAASMAAAPALEQVDRQLSAAVLELEAKLVSMGRLDPARVTGAPEIFKTMQSGWFNVPGEYMSEVKGVRRFVDEVKKARTAMGEDSARATLTDFTIALWQSSPDRQLAAGNAVILLDTLYNVDTIEDPDDMARHLEVRRIFSDLQMAMGQRAYLAKPHQPRQAQPAPALVRTAISVLSKLPGEKGRAIKTTVGLLGVEDLTASIFSNHAQARLKDPAVRERILRLHDALLERLRGARAGRPGPGLWELALEVSGGASEAVELLGVFTTQHRTLAKTLLPRAESFEAKLPVLLPLTRCASNFFLVQELDELTRAPGGLYSFPYPEGFATDNRRFYHFWSEAFIAHELARQGVSEGTVRFVTSNLGKAYESYTLPLNLRFAMKTGAKVGPVFGGWSEDVSAHKKGAEFGLSLSKSSAPAAR
ncbi:MAG: hypothetical protein HY816_00455 [Candidatus Wallbacteria bacterium]|nr:hypothetical protein [Candidatus Wallbacteria bacterium]